MELLDGISMGVFSYLKKHRLVSSVDHKTYVGASSAQLSVWDQKNHPCLLPDDLKRYYTVTNGLSVKWYALFQGQPTLVGQFSLNSVQDLQRQRVDKFSELCRLVDKKRLPREAADSGATVFPLEASPQFGEVALVFFATSNNKPQIWFRDLRGTWSFLALTFTHYYRMMIVHLGLISWPTIFSDAGLSPVYRPWFYLFVPQRIALDEKEESEAVKSATVEAASNTRLYEAQPVFPVK